MSRRSAVFSLSLLLSVVLSSSTSFAQGTILNGEVVTGSVTGPQMATYTFSLDSARVVCASIDFPLNSKVLPNVGIDQGTSGPRVCQDEQPGDHLLTVFAGINAPPKETTIYTLKLLVSEVPFSVSSSGGAMANGVVYPGQAVGSHLDIWSFDGSQGDLATFRMTNSGNTALQYEFQNFTEVFSPDGTEIVFDYGYTPTSDTFRLPVTGTYVIFAGNHLPETGLVTSYTLAVSGLSSSASSPRVTLLDPIDPVHSLLTGNSVTNACSVLGNGGRQVQGIAADGAAEIVVRIEGSSPGEQFHVKLNGDGFLTSTGAGSFASADLTVTASCGTGPYEAYAVYEAPLDFARSGNSGDLAMASRNNTLTVQSLNSGLTTSVPVTIWRPPLMLIHGIWSSPGTWKQFAPLVNILPTGEIAFDSRFSGYFVDYSLNSSNAVSQIVTMRNGAFDQMTRFIESFKQDKIAAAVQIDVVAHSMGGLVARDLVLAPKYKVESFGKGRIHKLITIGTPHMGTQLASSLLGSSTLCKAALAAASRVVDGAVMDLQPESALLNSLNSSPTAPLKAHAIAGVASSLQELESEASLTGVSLFASTATGQNVCFGLLPLGGYQQLFGGDSDLLVPVYSQASGFMGPSADFYDGVIHTVAPILYPLGPDELNRVLIDTVSVGINPAAATIPNRVVELLNTAVTQNDFTMINP